MDDDVRRKLQEAALGAIEALINIIDDDNVDMEDRMKAADIVLSYAYGSAKNE